ncbi:MAG: chemotaxis protein CheD [Rubellimicrobium sp.]|nr:chemotaxis protein CheD [Rubellimicrobium sp.]
MPQERVIHVIQGEFAISDRQDTMLTTVLGSCVSACIYDERRRIGGMNHFLLPGGVQGGDMRFAAASMERLVNGLLKRGATRGGLRAKLFGGGRIIAGLMDIGRRNADAALQFLETEGIACTSMSMGGPRARRVRFWPASGRAQQLLLDPSIGDPRTAAGPEPGSIDLF